jgi:hypothetical protein
MSDESTQTAASPPLSPSPVLPEDECPKDTIIQDVCEAKDITMSSGSGLTAKSQFGVQKAGTATPIESNQCSRLTAKNQFGNDKGATTSPVEATRRPVVEAGIPDSYLSSKAQLQGNCNSLTTPQCSRLTAKTQFGNEKGTMSSPVEATRRPVVESGIPDSYLSSKAQLQGNCNSLTASPPPPPPRTLQTRQVSANTVASLPSMRPGAFRVFPEEGRCSQTTNEDLSEDFCPEPFSRSQSDRNTSGVSSRTVSVSTIPTTESQFVLAATLVAESVEFQKAQRNLLSIPRATEVDPSKLSSSTRVRRRLLAVMTLLGLAGLITLGAVLGTAKNNKNQGLTFVEFRDSYLSRESAQRAQEDPQSPQARALAWMESESPSLLPWQMQQRYALAVLFYTWQGEGWANNTGWLSPDHECDWFYQLDVEARSNRNNTHRTICNAERRYVRLALAGNELNGTIPPELMLLADLQSIELPGNSLYGTLPTTLANLTKLRFLIMEGNDLNGTLPTELGELSVLDELHLVDNVLTGTLPTEIGRLTVLRTLDVRRNHLTGKLPTEYSSMPSLETLYVSSNSLSGPLPTELAQLRSLKDLSLCANLYHSGTIPTVYGLLPNLEWLSVTYNKNIYGTIPTELGNIPTLKGLYIEETSINGTIPSEL